MPYRTPSRSRLFAITLVGVAASASACADPCVDDGLSQDREDCPALNTATDSATDSNTESDTDSSSLSNSMSESLTNASNSMSASITDTDTDTDSNTNTDSVTVSDSDSVTESDTDGTLWCADMDLDGFGDPDNCTTGPDQPPGTVDNDDDCDDGDPDTFPGAAPNDDEDACMHDGDGDDWGDDDPGPGIDPGTDCDDNDVDTFPGAAENEPRICTTDGDGDGWGDANPGGGGDPGADCFDGNADLNPDTMGLTVFTNIDGQGPVVARPSIDGLATLSVTAQLDTPFQWDPVSATIDETGTIVINNDAGNRLFTVDYAPVCDGSEEQGTVQAFDDAHGADVFCGIVFGPDGVLYGARNDIDQISEFDLTTGQVASGVPLDNGGAPFDLGSCGMSFNCHTQQLLIADGGNGDIYTVDPATGAMTIIADTDLTWSPTGLAYEPVDRVVYVAGDFDLYRIAIDGSNAVEALGAFNADGDDFSISNIEVLPICVE